MPALPDHGAPRRRRRWRTRSALLGTTVAALAVVAACAGTKSGDIAGGPSNRTSTTAVSNGSSVGSSSTTTAKRNERDQTGSGQPVTFAFGGDASFEDLVPQLKSDPQGLLRAIAPTMSAADFSMVNLETSLGTTGQPQSKTFTFQVPPQAIDSLKAAGIDAVTMANNHGMDYGLVGLQDTLSIKASTGFPILGIGKDETEAYAPLITEIKGQRIGVIAASDVFDAALRAEWTAGPGKPGIASSEEGEREQHLVRQIKETRPKVDTLIVFLHWGTEKQTCPNPRQKELEATLADAGADMVIGSHPHRLQGVGFQGDRMVAYSLSNFVFKGPSAESRKSGVLAVTATGRHIDSFEWKPATLVNNVPVPLTGSGATAALAEMDQRQACAGLSKTATTSSESTSGTTAPTTTVPTTTEASGK